MQSNAVILCARNYLDKRVKEIYGFQNVPEMFIEMGIIEELPHFTFHVFEVVVQIAESDPLTQLFGFVIEGSQHQEILDHFIEVAHDVIPKMMKMEKLLESIEQEYEEEGEAWLFGNYNQGHRDFKEEREHEMAKSLRKFKKASSERIAKKYANAHQKLKKNLNIKKNLVKKVSKRSGKKHVIERV